MRTGDQPRTFREWMDGPVQELNSWLDRFTRAAVASLRVEDGFVSVRLSSATPPDVSPSPSLSLRGVAEPSMTLAAGTLHPGEVVQEAAAKDWKGQGAVAGVRGQVGWTPDQENSFSKAMSAGKRSLPATVGKEMGLLFEVKVFEALVTTYKLKPVGGKDLGFATAEMARLEAAISDKVGAAMAKLVTQFITAHAGAGPGGMAALIHSKAGALLRKCVLDAVEFTGGDGAAYSSRLRSDTADLRLGCEQFLPGVRNDVGFSLKAVTETQIEVRSFSAGKAARVLGADRKGLASIRDLFSNPLYDEAEKRDGLMAVLWAAAEGNYVGRPGRFAKLLEALVTGGADTIPAYRNLVRASSAVGWSGAVQTDFRTGEGRGAKIGAKPGTAPVIEVKKNKTYVVLKYMVPGGNHYGTSVKFEPTADGSKVSVVVSNLVSKR